LLQNPLAPSRATPSGAGYQFGWFGTRKAVAISPVRSVPLADAIKKLSQPLPPYQ
jgi:hypothetical protein